MALNTREIAILSELLERLKSAAARSPRVLFLGYPDILTTQQSFEQADIALKWAELKKQPAKESRLIWMGHRRYYTKVPILEVRALIGQLGGDPTITDAIATGKEDQIL